MLLSSGCQRLHSWVFGVLNKEGQVLQQRFVVGCKLALLLCPSYPSCVTGERSDYDIFLPSYRIAVLLFIGAVNGVAFLWGGSLKAGMPSVLVGPVCKCTDTAQACRTSKCYVQETACYLGHYTA